MKLRDRDHWICQNTACLAEFIVVASSRLPQGSNPRCSCGSIMKKPYSLPSVRNLEANEAEMFFEQTETSQGVQSSPPRYSKSPVRK
jgi:hypothetical protein